MGSRERGHTEKFIEPKKPGITAQRAIALLKKKGIDLDEKEAEKVLELLIILAKLEIDQYLNP